MAGFEEIRPEPARFWVRWAPRGWRGPQTTFLDLARGRLATAALRHGRLPAAVPERTPDCLYLPPVEPGDEPQRAVWQQRASRSGHPTVVQVPLGEAAPRGASRVVADPTAALLAGELERLDDLPAGAALAWPLIAGVSDAPELLRRVCARCRARGLREVQGQVPELSPRQRRRISERGGDEVYRALFHGPPPSLLPLARIAVEEGLSPWMERPRLTTEGPRGRNRELAAHLALVAEWRLLLGHPEGGGQALFRAARWVDEEARDVAAIATEGNLAVVDWLEAGARREIERFVAAGPAAARDELVRGLLAL